ncbi:MAG: CPBP family intramembrane glutamic endopeptidase [Bacteroidota bacterium]
MVEFSWDPEYAHFIIALLWSVVGFGCYYFLSRNRSMALKIWKVNPDLDHQVKQVVLQRVWGFLFLGIFSAMLILLIMGENLHGYGLGFSFLKPLPWWAFLLIPVILVVGFFSASKPGNLALYPQIRVKYWTPGILALSGFSWIIFLIGYEFLFRGFMLYASLDVMGPWAAIALNCSLYAFAHIYKGPGEAFGAIPVGILLCYLTLLTGNIWTAVIIHSVMALSNEWFSIRANPALKWKVESRKVESL